MNFSSLLNGIVLLFTLINGISTVLSSKSLQQEIESDYSSPFKSDLDFADDQFIDKKFVPTFINKDGVLPTLVNKDDVLPTFSNGDVLPTFDNDAVLPTFDKSGALPTFGNYKEDQVLPTFGEKDVLPTFEQEGLLPTLYNKQMNDKSIKINNDNKSSSNQGSFGIKLLSFGIIGVIIIGLIVFHLRKNTGDSKYTNITEEQYNEIDQGKEVGEITPLISV